MSRAARAADSLARAAEAASRAAASCGAAILGRRDARERGLGGLQLRGELGASASKRAMVSSSDWARASRRAPSRASVSSVSRAALGFTSASRGAGAGDAHRLSRLGQRARRRPRRRRGRPRRAASSAAISASSSARRARCFSRASAGLGAPAFDRSRPSARGRRPWRPAAAPGGSCRISRSPSAASTSAVKARRAASSRRRVDLCRQRRRAVRPGRRRHARADPARRAPSVQRGVEIVAQRRGQRRLQTGLGRDLRPAPAGTRRARPAR